MSSLRAGPRSTVHAVASSLDTTPAYLYDLAEVRGNLAALRAALPEPTTVYYSLKANPHPDILRELLLGGARAEVCSPGELHAALDAGWAAATLLYTGPGKRDTDLDTALAAGVRSFSVDSAYAIGQLDRLAAAHRARLTCLLRINDSRPARGQGLAMTGVASQFGVDTAEVLAAPAHFAGTDRVLVEGLHLYMGSNIGSVDELLAQFRHALETARELAAALEPEGVRFRVLDLGGGFGAPFAQPGRPVDLTGLRERLAGLLDELATGWRDRRPEVVFESGRYLVATAGTLVVTVLEAKRSHDRDVIVLDSGINHLGGMSGLRRLPPLNPRLLAASADLADSAEPSAGAGGAGVAVPTRPTLVTGPLCTPLDTWSRSADLPPLRPGDRLTVPSVGAYGLYASLLAFLGHPIPDEVVLDSDDPDRAPRTTRLELARRPERS
ncbi:type III PLP-dependent enzyme [Micromonospora sp. NPDC048170]|uniref:type III PLP-dependent enzyme n=1 Tax=Micromonospora sp. NPDC048170 TaxID=3154819 RepID=UPI0033CA5C22